MKAVIMLGDETLITVIPWEIPDTHTFTIADFRASKNFKSYEIPREIRDMINPPEKEAPIGTP